MANIDTRGRTASNRSSSLGECVKLLGIAASIERSLIFGILVAGLLICLAMAAPVQAAGLDDAKRGLTELVRGNFQEAVVYTTKAIDSGQLEPESLAITYFNRAEGHQRLGRQALAIDDFKSAYRAWPEHPITQAKMRDLGLLGQQ